MHALAQDVVEIPHACILRRSGVAHAACGGLAVFVDDDLDDVLIPRLHDAALVGCVHVQVGVAQPRFLCLEVVVGQKRGERLGDARAEYATHEERQGAHVVAQGSVVGGLGMVGVAPGLTYGVGLSDGDLQLAYEAFGLRVEVAESIVRVLQSLGAGQHQHLVQHLVAHAGLQPRIGQCGAQVGKEFVGSICWHQFVCGISVIGSCGISVVSTCGISVVSLKEASGVAFGSFCGLPREQLLFQFTAPVVFAGCAVAVDDAVAGHQHRHRILGDGRSHSAHGLRFTDALRNLLIGGRLTEGNLHHLMPHAELEVGAVEVELYGVVVALEDDALHGLRHGVALRRRGVLAPARCQFMDGLEAVVVEKLQVAYAVPRARDDNLAEGRLAEAEFNFIAHSR